MSLRRKPCILPACIQDVPRDKSKEACSPAQVTLLAQACLGRPMGLQQSLHKRQALDWTSHGVLGRCMSTKEILYVTTLGPAFLPSV